MGDDLEWRCPYCGSTDIWYASQACDEEYDNTPDAPGSGSFDNMLTSSDVCLCHIATVAS